MTHIEQLLKHCPSIKLAPAKALYNTLSTQTIIDINTNFFRARIALQGAQPLEYHNGNNDILWLSPHAVFDGKAAIRGGIPLCLPWFGVNQRDHKQAKHGFARNKEWQLISACETKTQADLIFRLQHQANAIYPYTFSCDIHWCFNTQLNATINVRNLSTKTMPFSYALHSYFRVEDKYKATVSGLSGGYFLDNTQGLMRATQTGVIHFEEEVDRVYENALKPLHIGNQNPNISITADNMPTAIVWNPDKNALNNPDIKTAYTDFICVERGAAFSDEIQLAANDCYQAIMTVSQI